MMGSSLLSNNNRTRDSFIVIFQFHVFLRFKQPERIQSSSPTTHPPFACVPTGTCVCTSICSNQILTCFLMEDNAELSTHLEFNLCLPKYHPSSIICSYFLLSYWVSQHCTTSTNNNPNSEEIPNFFFPTKNGFNL